MDKQYAKQMIQWAEESKQYLKISASVINETPNDLELGNKIRQMYWKHEKENDELIQRCKNEMK